jgi:hypothetical protein
MIFVPLFLLFLISIGVGIFAPIFGVGIFVIGFIAFLAFVGLRPRADERLQTPARDPVGEVTPHKAEERAGFWGEKSAENDDRQ